VNIVSYSLWGENQKYTIGAIRNAEMNLEFYPGWISRFYVGTDVPKDIIDKLTKVENTEVIQMQGPNNGSAMMWRFLAADSNDTVIVRDADCRPSWREVSAVDEWLSSDKNFHIMRDHPWHNTVIMGGMWGSRNGILRGIGEKIDQWPKTNASALDQSFLRQEVFPFVQNDCMIHDEFMAWGNGRPFPKPRITTEFVGMPYDSYGYEHTDVESVQYYRELIQEWIDKGSPLL
jgi:hypothetical protein